MVELVLAKLFDDKAFSNAEDYPETMLEFFDYIVKTNFSEDIYFTDYEKKPAPCNDSIRVFDPVNSYNNVARKYNDYDRNVIVSKGNGRRRCH